MNSSLKAEPYNYDKTILSSIVYSKPKLEFRINQDKLIKNIQDKPKFVRNMILV